MHFKYFLVHFSQLFTLLVLLIILVLKFILISSLILPSVGHFIFLKAGSTVQSPESLFVGADVLVLAALFAGFLVCVWILPVYRQGLGWRNLFL